MAGLIAGLGPNGRLKAAALAVFVFVFGPGILDNFMPLFFAGIIAIGLAITIAVAAYNSNRPGPFDGMLGSARFGGREDARKLEESGDLIIGRSAASGKLLRYDGPAHLLTMAPTRSGKGVGTIIPNLLVLDRSVICVDPKGENARVTARARRSKGPVWCLDPFGVSGQPAARYNPVERRRAPGVRGQ